MESIMDLDPSLQRIVDAERKRRAALEKRIEARLHEAREEARHLADRFVEADPRVRRVLLFGSVASGRVYREDFDIDLAYEGGHYTTFFLIAEESPFKVDVVDLEAVSPEFRRLVEQRGQTLYET